MSRNERRALIAAAAAIGLSMTPADAARLVEPTGFAEMRHLVEAHPEIERAIFPGLSAAPLLMGGKKAGLKPQDVFSTLRYAGNSAPRLMINGIDLSGKGGLVWTRATDLFGNGWDHALIDTINGPLKFLRSNTSNPISSVPNTLTGFLSTGYTLGTDGTAPFPLFNSSFGNYVSWTFRKAEEFFDVVTYVGDGDLGRRLPHQLGMVPGQINAKNTSQPASWWSLCRRSDGYYVCGDVNVANFGFDLTNAAAGQKSADDLDMTASFFNPNRLRGNGNVSQNGMNEAGVAYTVYLTAHNPSPDGVVQCGSFTTNGSGSGSYAHGWSEGSQFVRLKCATAAGDWEIYDTVRSPGWATDRRLRANSNAAEDIVSRLSETAGVLNFTGLTAGQTYVVTVIRAA